MQSRGTQVALSIHRRLLLRFTRNSRHTVASLSAAVHDELQTDGMTTTATRRPIPLRRFRHRAGLTDFTSDVQTVALMFHRSTNVRHREGGNSCLFHPAVYGCRFASEAEGRTKG
jgi:hypothetical protein